MIDIYSNIENVLLRLEQTIDKKEIEILMHYFKELLKLFKEKCFLEDRKELEALSLCFFSEIYLLQSQSYARYLTVYYLYEVVMEVLNDKYIDFEVGLEIKKSS